MKVTSLLPLVPLAHLVFAGPAATFQRRGSDLSGALNPVLQNVKLASGNGSSEAILAALRNVEHNATAPTSPEQALTTLKGIFNSTATSNGVAIPPPENLYQYIAELEALNIIDSIDSLLGFVREATNGQASTSNNNPPPPDVIYPQKVACDTPYSVSENVLRSAIYIPSGFTYGRIPPIILFPGTGNFGYETFSGNFIPLLTGSDFADPVWVNVPGRLLNDAQKNAEFAAYAINYIASVTGGNVTMLGWSQGNIDTQWAFKYWPSTTKVTSDHVAISPDYAGTILANFIDLGEPLPPSILQQRYLQSSNFITTLRSCDGDSGYVPTTTIYSGFFDEIVQPQSGTGASAFLKDARGVGVTNNEAQVVCAGRPAGTFYTHEGMLYNPLSYFLLKDAMSNENEPGRIQNLNLATVCSTYLTPGLDLGDLLVTENAVAIAGLAILTYPSPVLREPQISAYASTCPIPNCFTSTTTTTSMTSTSTSTTTSTSVSVSILTSISSSYTSTSTSTASWTSTTSLSTKSQSNTWSQWLGVSHIPSSQGSRPTKGLSPEDSWSAWPSDKAHTSTVTTDTSGKTQTWYNWPSTADDSAHVTTKTWTSGSATYTEYITVSKKPGHDGKPDSEWTAWPNKATPAYGTDQAYGVLESKPTDNAAGWQSWNSYDTNDRAVPTQSVKSSPDAAAQSSDWATWVENTAVADSDKISSTPTAPWSEATGVLPKGSSTISAHISQWTGAASRSLSQKNIVVMAVAGVLGLAAL